MICILVFDQIAPKNELVNLQDEKEERHELFFGFELEGQGLLQVSQVFLVHPDLAVTDIIYVTFITASRVISVLLHWLSTC